MAESTSGDFSAGDLASIDPESANKLLAFLHKHGLKDAEATVARELGRPLRQEGDYGVPGTPAAVGVSDGSAASYRQEYRSLLRFVDGLSDRYKPELRCVLYPTFANVYLELVANRQYEAAHDFFVEFAPAQMDYWQEFITELKSGQFILRVSRQSLSELKTFLLKHGVLQSVMRTRLHIDAVDGPPRSEAAARAVSGNPLGEPPKQLGKQKVWHGPLRDETLADDAAGRRQASAAGKKASKKDEKQAKKAKDPSAPPAGRIPLPDMSEVVRAERRQRHRDAAKRAPINADSPPYVLMYTMMNGYGGVTNMSFSGDGQWLATGGADSSLNVWTLNEKLLMPLKPPDALDKLDKESDTILTEMLDDTRQSGVWTLRGHSAPVYGSSFSSDKRLLLSCSADSTVRLWSTQLWHNLVVYQLGGYPIWDVHFAPRGYYFCTGGGDNSAAVWCTERVHPLRLLCGHTAGVRAVQFHPNCNYVLAGDAHRDVNMYDLLSGQCVRQFSGMKAGVAQSSVSAVCFSPDGRLAAACSDASPGSLCVWDVPSGRQLVACSPYAKLHSLSFGMVDSSFIVCGGVDDCVKIVGVDQLVQQATEDAEPKTEASSTELYHFATRKTRVLAVGTTAKNVVLTAGVFDQ